MCFFTNVTVYIMWIIALIMQLTNYANCLYIFSKCFQAATVLWITILRFMGDLPEPPYAKVTTSASIMSVLTETLSRNITHSKEYSEAIKILKVRL